MSDHPLLSKLATDRLREEAEAPIEAPAPPTRDRSIGLLAVAIAEQAQRRRRKRVAGVAMIAIAASVAAFASAKLLRHPPPAPQAIRVVAHPTGAVAVVHGGVSSAMAVGALLETGDRVRTSADAHASVVLSTGTHVEVDAASELAIGSVSAEQVFVAAAGAAKFSVAKLGPGERFLVRTGDTEVEVRGTIFRVGLAESACAGTFTRVEVTEGAVVVRHHGTEVRLGANDKWPSGCFAPPSAPAPVATLEPKAPEPPKTIEKTIEKPAKLAVAPQPSAAPSPGSDLALQNDLFAEGIAKKRAGDKIGAALTFERFLARWPSSSLSESAAVERMRMLSGEPARAAAKDYLARFPKGAARAEAESIAQ